jgi:hypothetical protein
MQDYSAPFMESSEAGLKEGEKANSKELVDEIRQCQRDYKERTDEPEFFRESAVSPKHGRGVVLIDLLRHVALRSLDRTAPTCHALSAGSLSAQRLALSRERRSPMFERETGSGARGRRNATCGARRPNEPEW